MPQVDTSMSRDVLLSLFLRGTYEIVDTITATNGFEAHALNLNVTSLLEVELSEADRYSLYDIVYVDGEQMYLSDGNAIEEMSRPDTLDVDTVFVPRP